MSIRKTLPVLGLLALSGYGTHSQAAEVLGNGGFETGDFAGWSATSNSNDDGCGDDWDVNTSGSTCGQVGGGAPGEGAYSAYNSFDGPGPIQYRLTQTVVVPANVLSASLSWSQSLTMSSSGVLRSFTVEIADAVDAVVHGTISNQVIPASANTPWTPFTEDITTLLQAHEGETVTLAFTNIIPENFTGPAGFGLDSVSLDVVAGPAGPPSQIPTIGAWGIGILSGMIGLLGMYHRRRK